MKTKQTNKSTNKKRKEKPAIRPQPNKTTLNWSGSRGGCWRRPLPSPSQEHKLGTSVLAAIIGRVSRITAPLFVQNHNQSCIVWSFVGQKACDSLTHLKAFGQWATLFGTLYQTQSFSVEDNGRLHSRWPCSEQRCCYSIMAKGCQCASCGCWRARGRERELQFLRFVPLRLFRFYCGTVHYMIFVFDALMLLKCWKKKGNGETDIVFDFLWD